jgi:YD repeat-containing protein
MVEGMSATLSNGADVTIQSGELTLVSPKEAWIDFSFTGQAPGIYDLLVHWPDGSSEVLVDAVTISDTAQAKFEASFTLPAKIRPSYGNVSSEMEPDEIGLLYTQTRQYTAWLEYRNSGTAQMDAPLVIITAETGVSMRLFDRDPFSNEPIQVLAISSDGPAGKLPPGASGRIPITFLAPLNVRAHQFLKFEVSQAAGENDQIDWIAIEQELRHPLTLALSIDTTSESWDFAWSAFQSRIGNTWGDYYKALSDEATYLARYGGPVYDARDLLANLFETSSQSPEPQLLSSSLDISVPAPGPSLAMTRAAVNNLEARFTTGVFGRVWQANFEYSLARPDNLTILVHTPGNGVRRFTRPLVGAAWHGDAGDSAQISEYTDGSIRMSEANGFDWLFNSDGQLTRIEDRLGNGIAFTYNPNGQLVRMDHASGDSLSFSYTTVGRLSQIQSSNGLTSSYSYDPNGEYLISATIAGVVTQYSYDTIDSGPRLLSSITTAGSGVVHFGYDTMGRLVARWLGEGQERVDYTYDNLGSVMIQTSDGETITRRYGSDAFLLAEQDAQNMVTRRAVSPDGENVVVTLADGSQITETYDSNGNLTQAVGPNAQIVQLGYTSDYNQLALIEDPRGNQTQLSYDDLGNLTGIHYADGSQEIVQYDMDGSPVSITNRNGDTIAYEFNERGLVTRKIYPDGRQVDYSYDSHWNLTRVDDTQLGIAEMTYDTDDHLTRVLYPDGRWLEYGYSVTGQVNSLSYPDGYQVFYQYDVYDRLVEISDSSGAVLAAYEFDVNGRLSQETKGNGDQTEYTYDSNGNLTSLVNSNQSGAVQSSYIYTYDARGNCTSETTPEGAKSYFYDGSGRLVYYEGPDGKVYNYAYDAAGNRVEVNENGERITYSTNEVNRYTQAGGTTFTHDHNGNITSATDDQGTSYYTYDPDNRLIGEVDPDGNSWEFTYTPLGDLASVSLNGETTHYLPDPIGNFPYAATADESGNYTHLVSGDYGLAAMGDGQDGLNYPNFDGRGNTRGIYSSSGEEIANYDYQGPYFENWLQTGTYDNQFLQDGRYGLLQAGNGITLGSSGVGLFNELQQATKTESLIPDQVQNEINEILDMERVLAPFKIIPYAMDNPLLIMKTIQENWLKGFGDCFGADTDCYKEMTYEKFIKLTQVQKAAYEHDTSLGKHFERYGSPYFNVLDGWVVGTHLRLLIQLAHIRMFGETLPIVFKQTEAVLPNDPNEKVGPSGDGDEQVVAPESQMAYTIYFENKADASAPAQEVYIRDTLSPLLDWESVQFTEFAYGGQTVPVTQVGNRFSARVVIPDYRTGDSRTWWLDVSGIINYTTGEIVWTLRTLDPATGLLPDDVLAGFLPPNNDSGRGEGHVSFTVQLDPDAPLGSRLTNQASIIFDTNEAILTNEAWNTVGDLSSSGNIFLPLVIR